MTHDACQDEDNFTVVEGSEFVISRTADTKSSSKYYVSGRPSSFTAVTELLKGKGVDLDNNRFLILQVCGDQPSLLGG